jgi:hypothetical protein
VLGCIARGIACLRAAHLLTSRASCGPGDAHVPTHYTARKTAAAGVVEGSARGLTGGGTGDTVASVAPLAVGGFGALVDGAQFFAGGALLNRRGNTELHYGAPRAARIQRELQAVARVSRASRIADREKHVIVDDSASCGVDVWVVTPQAQTVIGTEFTRVALLPSVLDAVSTQLAAIEAIKNKSPGAFAVLGAINPPITVLTQVCLLVPTQFAAI